MFRYQESQKAPITGNVHDDPILLEYNEKIAKLEEIAEKVLIQGGCYTVYLIQI